MIRTQLWAILTGSSRVARVTIETYKDPYGKIRVFVHGNGGKGDRAVAVMLGMKADKLTEKVIKGAVIAFDDPTINNFDFEDPAKPA